MEGSVFGFTYVYNNFVKDAKDACRTEEECFLQAVEKCEKSEYTTETEGLMVLFIMAHIKTNNKYTVKGFDDQNNCLVDIETINGEMNINKDKIISFIEDKKNNKEVYKNYLVYLSLIGELEELNSIEDEAEMQTAFNALMINMDKNMQVARDALKKVITDYFKNQDADTLESFKEAERAYPEQVKGTLQKCNFSDTSKLKVFLENSFTEIPLQINTQITYKDGKATSVSRYDGGECTSTTEN